MKRIRWSLIEKWWPNGQPFAKPVPAVHGRACVACGKCCALIRISVDLEYLREERYAWRAWANARGQVPSEGERRALRDYAFILDHWVRVPRTRAAEHGFVEGVNSADFVYHRLLLRPDGKCSAHDGFRPLVCEGYPFYAGKKQKKKTSVMVRVGCAFADKRFR